jgi:hypothetical protein
LGFCWRACWRVLRLFDACPNGGRRFAVGLGTALGQQGGHFDDQVDAVEERPDSLPR